MNIEITKKEFYQLGAKTTVCLLTLNNSFEIVGTSACVRPEDYKKETGEHLAEKSASIKFAGYKNFMQQNDCNEVTDGK